MDVRSLPDNWQKLCTIRAKAIHHAYPDTYVIWYKTPNNEDFLTYQGMSGIEEFAENQPKSDEEAAFTFIYQAFGVSV